MAKVGSKNKGKGAGISLKKKKKRKKLFGFVLFSIKRKSKKFSEANVVITLKAKVYK